jgi:hypothetical protein
MCQVLCNPAQQDTLRINRINTPIAQAMPEFLKIEKAHIEYVIRSLNNNSNISNINQSNIGNYLITSLYHAPRTIGYYFDNSFSNKQEEANPQASKGRSFDSKAYFDKIERNKRKLLE